MNFVRYHLAMTNQRDSRSFVTYRKTSLTQDFFPFHRSSLMIHQRAVANIDAIRIFIAKISLRRLLYIIEYNSYFSIKVTDFYRIALNSIYFIEIAAIS